MPRVSVIIPTCNRAELVERAIRSVFSQTYTDIEILVSDDASTDNTPQVIRSFTDPRIRYTRYEKNRGVIEVRNDAVKNSTGSYIAFLDDDDEWLPTKLEKQLSLLDDSPDNLGAVYTGAYSVDMDFGKTIYTRIPEYRGNILHYLLFEDFITTSSIVLKKSCFERAGLFDPAFNSASDYDMWIRIAKEFEFNYIKDILVMHRIQQNSISHNYHNVIMGLERLMSKHYDMFKGYDRAYGNHLFNLGIAYCFDNNMKDGRKTLLKSIRTYPYSGKLYYNLIISLFGYNMFQKIKDLKKKFLLRLGHSILNTGKITIRASIFKRKQNQNLDKPDV
jgi:glycosyltransferase involved in cell wall biosynthesis